MANLIVSMLLVVVAVICAARAIAAERILSSAIFLAAVSALTAVLLYMQGAYQVAAIELSVGAGLVTVLLVYAISVTGDEIQEAGSIVPRTLAGILAGVMVLGLVGLSLPLLVKGGVIVAAPLSGALWGQRVLDVWIQMVLIFAGVLGMLGLLTEGKPEMLQSRSRVVRAPSAGTLTGSAAAREEVRR
ncbi:MAG: hypothetical protein WC713_11000 [Candidatus Methylomirabilota bacterium]